MHRNNIYKIINVVAFLVIIFALFALNLLFSNKSGISEREKRELASMPNLTAKDYADGSFFKDYETYFADRFVFRDSFIHISDIFMSFKGYASDGVEIVKTNANLTNNSSENNEVSNAGQFIIVNNAGFETFTYNEYFMSFYINSINYYADNLSEDVKIYSIIAPTSIEFNLPEKYTSLTESQKKGIDYVNSKLRDNVNSVDVYSNLEANKGEYLYFKTDHHWTALGAYRAYEAFMLEKDEKPAALDSYERIESNSEYLGSIYGITSNKKLENNKDSIWYYNINEPLTYEVHDKNNEVIHDESVFYPRYFNREGKYAVFMGGDVAFAKITTKNTDKNKIMIIKDSYANAFIPFLIPHYSEIYVADPRSCQYNIINTIEQNNIDELLFVDYAMTLNLPEFSEMIKNLAIQNPNE